MEEILRDPFIYKIFGLDFSFSKENQTSTDSDLAWKLYIERKDMGIVCADEEAFHYKIVDKKKWMLAKIKYGI
jgi:hypothetical protein